MSRKTSNSSLPLSEQQQNYKVKNSDHNKISCENINSINPNKAVFV